MVTLIIFFSFLVPVSAFIYFIPDKEEKIKTSGKISGKKFNYEVLTIMSGVLNFNV